MSRSAINDNKLMNLRAPMRVTLSERDTRMWFDLMENPREPNARLMAAVKSMPGTVALRRAGTDYQ